MTAPSNRFRSASVSAPATPEDQLRAVLGDNDQSMSTAKMLIDSAISAGDYRLLENLEAVSRESSARFFRMFVVRYATAQLLQAAQQFSHERIDGWAPLYDAMTALLAPYLYDHPCEPELLNLAGLAYFELGDTPLARRLFQTVIDLEPAHQQARQNLTASKNRPDGATRNLVADELRPQSIASRAGVKQLCDTATMTFQKWNPKISLCMIVKNESEMLPGCLGAVADAVDEIIVVDTGSRDSTVEIAQSYGATVIDFPWTGSFSDARNRSVEDATGEWILYLDADEHLVEGDAQMLRELIRKPWVEAYYLNEINFTGEFAMGTQTQHLAMRLFQNRPEYRWRGIIHEQKLHTFPLFLPDRFQNSTVRINHYGYLKNIIDDRDKRTRNLELLEAEAVESPSAFNEFNIGSEYSAMGDWERARQHYERSLSMARVEEGWQSQQFAPMLVSRLVTARRGVSALAESIALIDEALGWWPDFSDLVFERALSNIELSNIDAAHADIEHSLELGDAPAKYVAVQGKGSFQSLLLRAHLERGAGDLAAARASLERALAGAPHFVPIVVELADVMLETDEPQQVYAFINERVGAGASSAQLLLGASFFERGAFDEAEELFNEVISTVPRHPVACIGLAELKLAQRRYDEALVVCQQVAVDDAFFAPRAARTEFLAALVAGDIAALGRPLSTISAASESLSFGERAVYAAWYARRTGTTASVLAADANAAAAVYANLEALARLEETDEFEHLLPLLEHAVPDAKERHLMLGGLYLRRHFVDMAAEEYMACANAFGPDPASLTGLGKVATMKEMWEDAKVFLSESLLLDPTQQDAQKLLMLIDERN